MKNSILALILLLSCGCGNFLSEYSQDMVRAKTIADFDEVLLGSVYLPIESRSYGTLIANSNNEYNTTLSWLNIMDDDINAVQAEMGSSSGSWDHKERYMNLMENNYGYYTWQYNVRIKPDGSEGPNDAKTWNDLYARINYTNVILDELAEIEPKNDTEVLQKNRVLGETYFLRAQFYFFLTNLYGAPYAPSTANTTLSVPLKLTAYVEHDRDKDTQFTRATQAEVYAQIVDDLEQAIAHFKEGEVSSYRKIYRANQEAAQLLLSRVYLYMQDWENARTAARDFLDMDVSLEVLGGDLTSPFLNDDNSEILFSQGSQHLQNVLTAIAPDFCVSSDLYNLYEEGDHRASFFQMRSSDSLALVNKYEMDGAEVLNERVTDIMPLRVAEGYLNMAEACAMLNDPEANTYLNALRRNRISGYVDQTYSGDELITQVRNERRKELCFEGHRWFDLRRYAVNASAPYHKTITHSYYYYSTDNQIYLGSEIFQIEENETNVWTFRIPNEVLDFDKEPMPNNDRDNREPIVDTTTGNETESEEGTN